MTVAFATVSLLFVSCEDEMSSIGNSISKNEVTINVDSVAYNLHATTVEAPTLESRSAYMLLGSISVPEYGDLDCSYVTQFLPAQNLNVPDSITANNIDSVKLILRVPKKMITGDSLVAQQVKVYSLTKSLPSDVSASFNPEGYYNPSSPIGIKSYNLSGETYNDTTFTTSATVSVKVNLPTALGREIFQAYKTDPEIFSWPSEFAKRWPGFFLQPTFGKGCMAAVQNTAVYAYFPKKVASSVTNEDGESVITYKTVADSICMMTTAPEVISSVNINYRPSSEIEGLVGAGKTIITTPGGYAVQFTFPAVDILDRYWAQEYDLGVINSLGFSIPAKEISNRFGIGVPPSLLMVKTSHLKEFFEEGKVPDYKNSFYGTYSKGVGAYVFTSLREYIVGLREKGKGNITDDDVQFTLIPVEVSTEEYTNPYTSEVTVVVTSVLPYIVKPTMVELDTEKANIVFTYSNQQLN